MLCDLIGLPLEARIIGATFEGGPTPRESTVYLLVSGDDEAGPKEPVKNP